MSKETAQNIEIRNDEALSIKYRFKRIGEDVIRVRFTDRPEDYGKTLPNGKETNRVRKWGRIWYEVVLTNEEMQAFFTLDGVTLNGLRMKPSLADALSSMIEEIKESQEQGKSYYDERVTVQIVKEKVTVNSDGSINLDAEYVLIGDSGKEYAYIAY